MKMAKQFGFVNKEEIGQLLYTIKDYQRGLLEEEDFTVARLQNGIYGQRQDGYYMVRIKIPGGELDLDQLDCLGQLVAKFSTVNFANITTRQDIQLHFVSLESLPKVLLRLADVGLTTREACGNTVRNITACALSGHCEKEHKDIRPLVYDTAKHFLRHPLTQHLPRKFKMSFSGCETDCAQARIHDLAVVASRKDNVIGYKVLVGGGLGHKPKSAIVLEEFVEEDKLTAVIESVIILHNTYSDRTKRARSRIKFIVEKFGKDEFIRLYQDVLKRTLEKFNRSKGEVSNTNYSWCKINFSDTKSTQVERTTSIALKLELGDLSVNHVQRIVNVMKYYGLSKLRTSQNQNIILLDVPINDLNRIKYDLAGFDIDDPLSTNKLVSCPGSWTCRLGITNSRDLTKRLSSIAQGLQINVSGCHNSCAQPQIADIGLHGEGRRKFGKLIPHYRMYFAGNGSLTGQFAIKGPEIPVARIESAISRIVALYQAEKSDEESFYVWAREKVDGYFAEVLKDLGEISEEDVSLLIKDVGEESDFKVLQLGGGECAGISEETASALLAEVSYEKRYRDVFLRQNELSSAVECGQKILSQLLNVLLFNKGVKHNVSSKNFKSSLNSNFVNYPLLLIDFIGFYEALFINHSNQSKEDLIRLFQKLDDWNEKITSFVKGNVVAALQEIKEKESAVVTGSMLDLTNDYCPMHFVKARKALSEITAGSQIRIALKAGEDTKLVSSSLTNIGFDITDNTLVDESMTILTVLKPIDHEIKRKLPEKEL